MTISNDLKTSELFRPSGQLLAAGTAFGRAIEVFAVAPTGHSGTRLDLLVRLSFATGNQLRAVELCEQLLKSPGYVSRVIDSAEAAGLVERRPDPTDGRAQLVGLTDSGRSVLDEFIPLAKDVLGKTIYHALDATEIEILTRLLGRIAESAHAMLDRV